MSVHDTHGGTSANDDILCVYRLQCQRFLAMGEVPAFATIAEVLLEGLDDESVFPRKTTLSHGLAVGPMFKSWS